MFNFISRHSSFENKYYAQVNTRMSRKSKVSNFGSLHAIVQVVIVEIMPLFANHQKTNIKIQILSADNCFFNHCSLFKHMNWAYEYEFAIDGGESTRIILITWLI